MVLAPKLIFFFCISATPHLLPSSQQPTHQRFSFLPFAGQHHASSDYPSPDISLGPAALHQSPSLIQYLYPHGLYPGASVANPLLTTSGLFGAGHPAAGMNPSLLFNAQLALASQNPFLSHAYHALNSHQQAAQPASPHNHHHLKAASLASGVHRFAPYPLPLVPPSLSSSASGASAFDAVLPGLSSRAGGSSPSSPSLHSTKLVRSPSVSPKSDKSATLSPKMTGATTAAASSLNELKSMEKMVNGLDSSSAAFAFAKHADENSVSSNDLNGSATK